MSSEQVIASLDLKPDKRLVLEESGRQTALVYHFTVKKTEKTIRDHVGTIYTYTVDDNENFYFVFLDDNLIHWGFLLDFALDRRASLREIGERISVLEHKTSTRSEGF